MESPIIISYPSQTIFQCPICKVDYSIYSSWTRHLQRAHPLEEINVTFECSTCNKKYGSKKSISNHYTKSHGPITIDRSTSDSGTLKCEFCEGFFPNKKSLSQHIRNQHPAEASSKRNLEASQNQTRSWTRQEHALLMEALHQYGPSSNVKLAEVIGTKSTEQVGRYKRNLLRNNPNILLEERPTTDNTLSNPDHPSEGVVSPKQNDPRDIDLNLDNSNINNNNNALPLPANTPMDPNYDVLPPQASKPMDDLPPQADEQDAAPPDEDTNEVIPLTSETNQTSQASRKDMIKQIMSNFSNSLNNYTERQLNNDEWMTLSILTTNWIKELKSHKNISKNHPPTHNTTHWKKRARKRTANNNQETSDNPHQETPGSSNHHPSQEKKKHHRQNRKQQACKLQKFYRANRKKCIRSIVENSPRYCNIPAEKIEKYFNSTPHPPNNSTIPNWIPSRDPQADTSSSNDLTYPITKEEMEYQLRRLPYDSSPGPDGIDYSFWKSISQEGKEALCKLYNICLSNERVPSSWKESNTILIYKKGDPNNPANWRPIALQNSIYKIYAAILAKRLACWCIDNGTISPMQKGFLPYEGCFEHSFMMSSLFEDSKRRCRDLRVVWFDLKNAFGNVTHDLLFDMMNRLNIPSEFINVCKDIYTSSTYRVRTLGGYSNPIHQKIGVKQGCPLSPLIFNLVIQGMLIGLDNANAGYAFSDQLRLKYLAYADDLCIIGTTKDEIHTMMNTIEKFCAWAQLEFNVDKCAALSMINSKPRKYVESFSHLYKDGRSKH